MKHTSQSILRAVFGLFSVICLLSSAALAAPVQFDIPAQPVSAALQLFGQQAKVEVVYPASELRKVQSVAIKGDMDPVVAIEQLLAGTGYTVRQISATNFAVSKIEAPKPGSVEGSVRDESGKPVAGARVSLADSDKAATTDKRGRFVIAGIPAGAHVLQIAADGMQNTRVTDVTVHAGRELSMSPITIPVRKQGTLELETYSVSAKKNDGILELDPYSVEGRRDKPFTTANLDLTRTRDDSLPFQIYTARDIEVSGQASLLEFFQNRLPQNFNPTVTNELNYLRDADNRDTVNMRGWGDAETVYLLNGRRIGPQYRRNLPDANSGADLSVFNQIPLGSIERIELLPSAGSAIYGAGVTGGVINIITRQDFRGGQLSFHYETPADVHRPQRGVDFSYAMPLRWGVGLRLAASYNEREPLRVRDRSASTSERWRQLVVERDPARLSQSAFYGATPNVRVPILNAAGNFTGNNAYVTSVPPSYAGGGGLAPFLERKGAYNLELAEGISANGAGDYQAKDNLLGYFSDDTVIGIGLDRSFSKRWRLSVDYRYAKNNRDEPAAGSLFFQDDPSVTATNNPSLPAAAPTNPFGQAVKVYLVDPRLQRPELGLSEVNENHEISSTLRGGFGEWLGFVDVSYAHNKNGQTVAEFFEPIDGWHNALLTGIYNPLVDVRVVAPAAQTFYDHYVQRIARNGSGTKNYQATTKASGPLFRLPMGSVQLTAGAEWMRSERYASWSMLSALDSLTGEPRTPVARIGQTANNQANRRFTSENYAGYCETTLPLLSPAMGIPLVRKVEVFGSGRISYSERNGFRTSGSAGTPGFDVGTPFKVTHQTHVHATGISYEMIEGLRFRSSISIGFKPPTISQITPALPPTANTTFTDPIRNHLTTLLPAQYVTGGNPELSPETTESTNIGLIFSPRWAPGLRISVDYLKSVRDDFIASLSVSQTAQLEPHLPGRVQRGPSDGHPSGVGPIVFIDARQINFRLVASESMDYNIDQEFSNFLGGKLLMSVAATQNISFRVQTTNTTPPVEQINNASAAFARQINWNANGQVRWEGKRWSFGWNSRYYDDILAKPNDWLVQGSDRADWELNHDVFAGYRLPATGGRRGFRAWLSGTSITVGVKNVFDRAPRFWAENGQGGIAPYDSVAGRTVWMKLTKNF